MIMTQEQVILKGRRRFDEIVGFVQRAARDGRPIDEVERGLWASLLALGRTMLESYVAAQSPGDLGSSVTVKGGTLRRLEQLHDRRYVSVFGELTISRTVYGTRETQKHELVPLDARLGLPEGDFSHLLQEWDQSFCVQGSYDASRQTVRRVLGLGQSVRSLEQMNVAMAREVESFRDAQPTPPPEEAGSLLVLTADGKGIPMRRDQDERPVGGRRQKGEKANQKRMACVGAAYTIERFRRTAAEVVDEVLREQCRAERPRPRHKQLRAELTRELEGVEVNGKDLIFEWFRDQVDRRDPDNLKPLVCVMDGERALWKTLKTFLPSATCILDLFHVLERLWTVAHCFHREGSAEARQFVADRLERILSGEVGYVIGGLRQMATKHRLKGARLKRLTTALTYLHNNRQIMRYDEYLTAGYPIGSGVVEGACRHLVKDRMEQTGMRWRTPGAQAMLSLRAVHINGDWDDFQKFRIRKERRRLYPDRRKIMQMLSEAA